MRFLHTADWHLGRLFHAMHLTEDQSRVLDDLIAVAREAQLDAIVLAGDVYDRAVPPVEAVKLYSDVLRRMALDVKVPLIAIAGNHDSPLRLSFASDLLRETGVHVFDNPRFPCPYVELRDAHGPVRFLPVPYAEPAVVRQAQPEAAADNHDQAMRHCAAAARQAGERARSVLVAHAFVQGGAVSESERPLSVGGADQVAADALEGFNYVALGHLHRPQEVGSANIRYSGSLMKYSFSEADHEKACLIVEMDATGQCSVEAVPLRAPRDVRTIRGKLQELIAAGKTDPRRDDYIQATLTDDTALLDPMGRLREAYPNIMEIRRPELEGAADRGRAGGDVRKKSDGDIFRAFFSQVTGANPLPEQEAAFADAMNEVRHTDGGEA